ncbi:MAG: phosphoenolpyruvate carboxykinase (ATP) [Bdellovibrio sp.]|nr:MAG: phosphoenolpyruvate carboxykinase (ATP) [Bdellovibrio sp.]
MDQAAFIEESLKLSKGVLSHDGALVVRTGSATGRSTKERFVVAHPSLKEEIHWGAVNQPIEVEKAQQIFKSIESFIEKQSHSYEVTKYVGCFKVTVKTLCPWHAAFAQNMFRASYIESLRAQVPDDIHIQIFHVPENRVMDLGLDFPYEKVIVLDPQTLKVGIVGTAYAGEIKKSAFTLCNYLFPKYGIFPMHASANCLEDGTNSSVLFGLSGTGKTTLSADPDRCLIGDDEIVWSKSGISNLEGGCYAKLIRLSQKDEPEIYKAANRFGAILENVAFNPETREIDFFDDSITENTRASYPLEALDCVYDQTKEAEAPRSIVFLTADAFGALPAVAKLDSWQAQYHFISGYTAKVAGTEIGVKEPQATFSACFGAPFMPRPASVYGDLLAQYMERSGASVWLLNTGWVKGYGKSDRFPIPVSRSLLKAIQSGELDKAPMETHPIFGFQVPTSVPGVDSQWLEIPLGEATRDLAKRFIDNANALGSAISKEVIQKGGPHI